jgi:hypothetical protein
MALPRGQGSACTGAWRPSADFGPLASHLTACGNSRANHAAASATLLPASPALPSLLQVGPTMPTQVFVAFHLKASICSYICSSRILTIFVAFHVKASIQISFQMNNINISKSTSQKKIN